MGQNYKLNLIRCRSLLSLFLSRLRAEYNVRKAIRCAVMGCAEQSEAHCSRMMRLLWSKGAERLRTWMFLTMCIYI